MPEIDNCAKVVPSRRFDKSLREDASWLEASIIELVVRIACNPYDEAIVHLCQLRPPDNFETFFYRSPRGFELYWDVELEEAHLPRTADMRIVLTELRVVEPSTSNTWLNHPVY